jgi:pseudouridine synthase
MERLQRILAARGVASRRAAEELIAAGRVSVDGQVVTQLGTKADPDKAVILVDGNPIKRPRLRYLILNKPSGYITTVKDERGRWTVMKLIHVPERVYPVGRLDRDTEGLLLFTNDGDVANRVMHPKYGLAKEYQVLTLSRPADRTLQRLRDGVVVEGKTIVPKEVRLLRETREGVILTITVHEGMYHLVRRLMEAVGIPVERLRRVRIGPLSIGNLALGESRDLTQGELSTLMEAIHIDESAERRVSGPTEHRPGPRRNRPRPDAPQIQRPLPSREERVRVRDAASANPPRRREQAPYQENRRNQPLDRSRRRYDEQRPARPLEFQREDEVRRDHPPYANREPGERDEFPRPPSPRRPSNERDEPERHRSSFRPRRDFNEQERPVRQHARRDDERAENERRPFNDQRGRHRNYQNQPQERAEPWKGRDADDAGRERGPADRSRSRPTSPHRDRRSSGGGQDDRRAGPGRPRRRDLP